VTGYRGDDEATIPFGPGAVHLSGDGDLGWVSADVALKLQYENASPGATRAVLELIAEQVDKASSSDAVSIVIELTWGDLWRIRGTCAALISAIAEDDAQDGPFGDPALVGENGHPEYRSGD